MRAFKRFLAVAIMGAALFTAGAAGAISYPLASGPQVMAPGDGGTARHNPTTAKVHGERVRNG